MPPHILLDQLTSSEITELIAEYKLREYEEKKAARG